MNTIPHNPDPPDLNYAPPRVVSFGWIGEAFALFSAKPGLWIAATLVAFVLPILLLFLLDFLLGDPLSMNPSTSFVAQTGGRPIPGGVPYASTQAYYRVGGLGSSGQWVLLVGIELVVFIASSFFYGALFRMAVQQVRGLPVTARDIGRGGRVFGPVTGFSLLFLLTTLGLEIVCFAPALAETYLHFPSLAGTFNAGPNAPPSGALQTLFVTFGWFALGTVLFLIASVLLVGLLLPGFALVADGGKVAASFGRSVRAMRGEWLSAAGLVFVMGLLFLVSEIPLGLGLLVTVPMAFLLPALAYRDMVGMPARISPAPPAFDPPQAGVWPPPPMVGQEYGAGAANRAASPEDVEDKR